MTLRLNSHLKIYNRYRRITTVSSVLMAAFIVSLLIINLTDTRRSKAVVGNENFSIGSYIINMGITPQTVSNGLKPYGLIYDLITNYQVPVKWIINQSKVKDGSDFSYNSTSFKGGPFIIPAEFITPTISSRIAYWVSIGVQGVYTTSEITAPVYTTLTSFPLTMIDSSSSLQAIIVAYYANAGIPGSAYSIGTPAGLNNCFDLWANPHGDPTWASHNYLYNFVRVNKSWIWAECHAVSMMEYCKSSGTPVQQLNFLTTGGLKCWGSGKCGTNPEIHTKNASAPYTYSFPTDPVMQFMGNMHNACTAGSEQWYQPISTGQWYSNTRRGVTTGTGTSPKEGVVLVYGPAYNDSTNGWAMYIGGHSLDSGGSSLPDRVSAQRAFLNYLLLAGTYRKLNITATIPSTMVSGQSDYVSASVLSGTPPFTYRWSSSLGSVFSDSTSSSSLYTAPVVSRDTFDVVRIKVTDQCGRVNFYYKLIYLTPPIVLPVKLLSFEANRKMEVVHLSWKTASEVNNNYFSIYRSLDGVTFNKIGQVSGNGNTTTVSEYEYDDQFPVSGLCYYQLCQTDYDGVKESFPPVLVKGKCTTKKLSLTVSPNPFTSHLNLFVFSKYSEQVKIVIYDLKGKTIYSCARTLSEGNNSISIETGELPQGLYTLVIGSDDGTFVSQKIFKNN